MSTESNDNNETTVAPEDAYKNIKAEFERKQANTLAELESIKSQLSQVADTVLASAADRRSQANEDAPDPVLDPKGYREFLRNETRREIEAAQATQAQKSNILSSLAMQYPELTDQSSELSQEAVKIYARMSKSEQANPNSFKSAILEAASSVGVLPVNKRKQNPQGSDDFTINSSSSGSPRGNSKQKDAKLDEATVEFARLLGRPVDDPKYIEKLKSTAQRKSWSKYR